MLIKTFITERWYGLTPIRQLFWRDLLVIGTFVNLLFIFTSMILLAKRMDPMWSLLLHVLPTPYNLLLVASVLRHPDTGLGFVGIALMWLLLTVIV